MNCYFSGITGLALLGGSIGTMTVTEEQHQILRNVFSDDLDQKYEKIVIERRNHYLFGILLGIFLSFMIMNYVRLPNYFARVSFFFTITLATALIFYMLMPKSDYILNHLRTPEENKKWLEVYNTMKSRYFIGLVLGALVAIPVATLVC